MSVLAIDPGPTYSTWLVYDVDNENPLVGWEKIYNAELLRMLQTAELLRSCDYLALEMVASYGMAVGREVFETVFWSGRFVERWALPFRLVYRLEVKKHLCKTGRHVTDANIRAALLDKFGPGKDLAVGKKATPGPLYGLSKDGWAALGVAVTAEETEEVSA